MQQTPGPTASKACMVSEEISATELIPLNIQSRHFHLLHLYLHFSSEKFPSRGLLN